MKRIGWHIEEIKNDSALFQVVATHISKTAMKRKQFPESRS